MTVQRQEKSQVLVVGRVSTKVPFWLPTEYGIFWKINGIPRNSAVFFAVKTPGIPRIPYVFAYGIPHVSKRSRFQIPPWIKNIKCWTVVLYFNFQCNKLTPLTPLPFPRGGTWTVNCMGVNCMDGQQTRPLVYAGSYLACMLWGGRPLAGALHKRKLLNVSFWRYREFRTWKKSRNYTTWNSAEFRRNFNQFRTEYGIDGSKKNRRNSVSTEFRGHPSCWMFVEDLYSSCWV